MASPPVTTESVKNATASLGRLEPRAQDSLVLEVPLSCLPWGRKQNRLKHSPEREGKVRCGVLAEGGALSSEKGL